MYNTNARTSEDDGVWFEPIVNGTGVGFEVKVHGPLSDKVLIAEEKYLRMRGYAARLKDSSERADFIQKAAADRYTECISAIRGKNGKKIKLGSSFELNKDSIFDILYSSPSIISSISTFMTSRVKNISQWESELEAAVKQYFFLYSYHEVPQPKVKEKDKKKKQKPKYVRYIDKRNAFIKKFGREEFDKISEVDDNWKRLRDSPFPDGSIWLFNHFLEIWYSCEVDFAGNVLFRPRDIVDYCECTGIYISYYERKLMLRMKDWARFGINSQKNDDSEN